MLLSALATIFVVLGSGQCDPFTATISLSPEYPLGEDVTCSITLTNNQNEDYFFLRRDTPFEGVRSHTFSITESGKTVDYDGFLFKRGPPSKEEYVLVQAKSSVSTVVDLALAYNFGTASKYTAKLVTTLSYFKHDHINSSMQHLYSNTGEFSLTASGKSPKLTETETLRRNSSRVQINSLGLKPPRFAGKGTSSDVSIGAQAYNAAYNVLNKCASSASSNPGLYKTWFGTANTDTVKGTYLNIESAMTYYSYTLYLHGEDCSPGVVAYTFHRAMTIFMCDGYFNAPTLGIDSKMGTIVHEMSHAVALTEDIKYGTAACMLLAKNYPLQAVTNADNYEYFAENQ